MSVVDIVLGCLVLTLAGWALVQCGSAKPPRGGCGCASRGCSSGESPPEDEQLVVLGGGQEPRSER